MKLNVCKRKPLPLLVWFMRAATVVGFAALSACGGSSDDGTRKVGTQVKAAAAAGTNTAAAVSTLSVTSLVLKAERRVSRTVYEYDFQVVLKNNGDALAGVVAQLTAVGAGTSIVDGTVSVGAVGDGVSLTPTDTITLRHNRALPFLSGSLVWQFIAQPGGTPLATSTIGIAIDVQPAIASRIKKLVSRVGSGAVNLPMPVAAIGDPASSTVYALDGQGSILLGGTVTPGSTAELTATSTSLALLRILMPVVPGGLGSDSFAEIVKTRPAFQSVVSAVQDSFAAGIAPMESASVRAALLTLAESAASATAQSSIAPSSERKRAQQINPNRPNGGAPLSTIPSGLQGRSVYVTDSLLSFGIFKSSPKLKNSTPLFWAAVVKNSDGNPVVSAGFPEGGVIVSPASLQDILGNYLLGSWFGPKFHDMPDTKGASFTLSVVQSKEAIAANAASIGVDVLDLLADSINTNDKCIVAVGKLILDGDAIGEFVAEPTGESFRKLLLNRAANLLSKENVSILFPTEIQQECLKKPADVLGKTGEFLAARLKTLATAYKIGETAIKVTTLVDKAYLLVQHASTANTLGICLDRDGYVRTCAMQFKGDPESYFVSPGAIIDDWHIRAFYDDNGLSRETGVPITLQADIDKHSIASVEKSEVIKVTALTVGDAKLLLSDSTTGATGTTFVNVRVPKFSRSSISTKTNEIVTVDFVDSLSGKKLDFNGETTFYTTDADKVVVGAGLLGIGQSPTRATYLTFKGLKAGSAKIFAHNTALNNVMELDVIVTDTATYSGPVTMTGIAYFSFPCAGTASFNGSATLTTDGKKHFFRLHGGNNVETTSCYSANSPLDLTWEVISDGAGGYTGTWHNEWNTVGPPFWQHGVQDWTIHLTPGSDATGPFLSGVASKTGRDNNRTEATSFTYDTQMSGPIKLRLKN